MCMKGVYDVLSTRLQLIVCLEVASLLFHRDLDLVLSHAASWRRRDVKVERSRDRGMVLLTLEWAEGLEGRSSSMLKSGTRTEI